MSVCVCVCVRARARVSAAIALMRPLPLFFCRLLAAARRTQISANHIWFDWLDPNNRLRCDFLALLGKENVELGVHFVASPFIDTLRASGRLRGFFFFFLEP